MSKVILAVDVAKSSGWCIRLDGAYFESGQVSAYGPEVLGVCLAALALDKKAQLVLEQPSHGNRATLVGLGVARGAWLAAWCQANGTKAPTRLKSVFPAKWRSQLFGSTGNFPLQEKLHAQLVAKRRDLGPDECAAIAISSWAVGKSK